MASSSRGHAEYRRLSVCVARPDISLVVYGETVRKRKDALTEAPQQRARRIELQYRWLRATDARGPAKRLVVEAPVKHPEVALRVERHPDQLSPHPSIHALRKCGPVFDQAIWIRKRCRIGLRVQRRSQRGAHRNDGQKRESDASHMRHCSPPGHLGMYVFVKPFLVFVIV